MVELGNLNAVLFSFQNMLMAEKQFYLCKLFNCILVFFVFFNSFST